MFFKCDYIKKIVILSFFFVVVAVIICLLVIVYQFLYLFIVITLIKETVECRSSLGSVGGMNTQSTHKALAILTVSSPVVKLDG